MLLILLMLVLLVGAPPGKVIPAVPILGAPRARIAHLLRQIKGDEGGTIHSDPSKEG